ncbi:MAG: class I SAM-dependent methyltransferase [Acidimicrobiales bacterium]|nr:class I SAM-dependent methyltransferase [Acidimicrobiales bacterium]
MAGSISELPAVPIEGHQPMAVGSADHPMRQMTRRAAGLVPDAPWDDAARAEVAAYFDDLAPTWHTRTSPGREAVVADVLERGVPTDLAAADVCVELGSGIGAYTPLLAQRWRRVLAVELAFEMLQRAPAEPGHRVLADGALLPVADGSVDAVVLVNCFLFPLEVDRVLPPDGLLVWVNSSGTHTPIHLSSTDVVTALPGRWEGVASEAGEATWCVVRRSAA